MRTPLGNQVFAIIRQHAGADASISAPQICRQLGWPPSRERLVRQLIADEAPLWDNVLVCSIPGKGYFCAETYEEALSYRNWIADLARTAKIKLRLIDQACARMGFNFTRERKVA